MKRLTIFALMMLWVAGCTQRVPPPATVQPTAFGAALVESSGGKQIASVGAILEQPLVVQVNDAQGTGVAGALVSWKGPAGVVFSPSSGLTDSSGQLTSTVTLGGMAGRYRLTATTRDRSGKPIELVLDEIALGYQQVLGRRLNEQHCVRCHDPESTPERVSNMDNLDPKPHAFSDGDVLNKMADADLIAIISHGGPALSRSPLMPPYGFTLDKNQIQALVAYIRAVADPALQSKGLVYAQK